METAAARSFRNIEWFLCYSRYAEIRHRSRLMSFCPFESCFCSCYRLHNTRRVNRNGPMSNITTGSANDIESGQAKPRRTGLLATGGLLAALGVSSCCVLPVMFMSVGLGGAWLSNLFALSAYQPIFIILATGFLGTGFYYVYRTPRQVCEVDSSCATPTSNRVVKSLLWIATVFVIAGIIFPYLGQYLLEM